jgi:hypothetical protein
MKTEARSFIEFFSKVPLRQKSPNQEASRNYFNNLLRARRLRLVFVSRRPDQEIIWSIVVGQHDTYLPGLHTLGSQQAKGLIWKKLLFNQSIYTSHNG